MNPKDTKSALLKEATRLERLAKIYPVASIETNPWHEAAIKLRSRAQHLLGVS